MEALILHTACLHDEPALSSIRLFVVIVISSHHRRVLQQREVRCCWWLCKHKWISSPVITEQHNAPIVKAAFPEFAELNGDIDFVFVLLCNVSWLNLVPGEN